MDNSVVRNPRRRYRSATSSRFRAAGALAAGGLVLALAVGCTGASSPASAAMSASSSSSAGAPAAAPADGGAQAADAKAGSGSSASSASAAAPGAAAPKKGAGVKIGAGAVIADRQVIRTASVTLNVAVTTTGKRVDDTKKEQDAVDAAVFKIQTLASAPGYVGAMQGKGTTMSITLRVPAGSYDSIMGQIDDIGTVVSRQEATEDVTAQMADLDGRTKTMKESITRVRVLLSKAEKIGLMEAAKDVARGRVPVIAGIAEMTTAFASDVAREAERVGLDGIMVMPALVYSSKPHETAAHFRGVSTASDLPIMVYNNPPIYRNDVTPSILASLADCDTIVCFKESSGDTRRFMDVRNMVGGRFVMFAGLDDVVVESVMMGAVGWVSGMSNAFPREGETLFRLARVGRYDEAMPLHEWFMPLLHLDARPDLVQCIKLCEHIMGRGTDLTRPPRLALLPEERAEIERMMKDALANRPKLPEVGLKAAA